MSQIAFLGAVEIGLVYAFVAIGVFLAFRVLDFPDLTVDGSFPLGAAVAAVMITSGIDPWTGCLAAILGGATPVWLPPSSTSVSESCICSPRS